MLMPQTRKEPSRVRAGDTVVWSRTFPRYSPADFTLKYVLVSATTKYVVDASPSDDAAGGFDVSVPGDVTTGWVPGVYRWEAYLKDSSGERVTVDQGQLTVLPDLEAASGGVDVRDDDERMLDAIKSLLTGKVLEDAQSYKIHGRELTRYSMADLRGLRSEYALRVRNNRIARGERVSSRTVRTAFFG